MCAATGREKFAVSEFLSPEDLRALTERQHKDAQAKAPERPQKRRIWQISPHTTGLFHRLRPGDDVRLVLALPRGAQPEGHGCRGEA